MGDREVTPEMIEAGAKALGDLIWQRDPFAKQMPVEELARIAQHVYRAMAALEAQK